MIETIATLIIVFCGILSLIITACTIQAPYSKIVANILKTLLIIGTISGVTTFISIIVRLLIIH